MYPNQYCQPCQPECPEVEVPPPPACEGEPCVEIVTGPCVRYTGPAIPCAQITTGMNLNEVVQLLAAKICTCCDQVAPQCAVPEISAQTECSEDGVSFFTIVVSTDHVATDTDVIVEVRNSGIGAQWGPAGSITTTGDPQTDTLEINVPFDQDTTDFYFVRAKRSCEGSDSAYSEIAVIVTPECNVQPACDAATGLTATVQ